MSYQRFNKGGRVAESPFLEKSVQKLLNLNINKLEVTFFNFRQMMSETKRQT